VRSNVDVPRGRLRRSARGASLAGFVMVEDIRLAARSK